MSKVEEKLRRKHGGFMIGDLVLVDEFFERVKSHRKGKAYYDRVEYPCRCCKPEPRAGWVCGFTSLRPGKLEFMGMDEGWAYEPTGSIEAVRISFWPHLKPVLVPYDGFRAWREGDPDPYPPNGSPKDIERAKADYEKWKDDMPRDEQGRFTI